MVSGGGKTTMPAEFYSEGASSDPGSVLRSAYRSRCRQWAAYDKLARITSMRGRDLAELRGDGVPPTQAGLARLVFREEWRADQEVRTLSEIARQDAAASEGFSAAAAGKGGGGGGGLCTCPGGQVRAAEEPHGDLRSLQDEELGFLFCLVSEDLVRNAYNTAPAAAGGGGLWKGTADHKPDVARQTNALFQEQVARCAPEMLAGLFAELQDLTQLVNLCEIWQQRQPAEAATADPFLHCCARLAEQRRDWLAEAEQALERLSLNTSKTLHDVRKAAHTLQKIQYYRRAQHATGGGSGNAPADASAAAPALPSLPCPPDARKPRTVTPASLDAAPPPSRPRATSLSKPVAAFRLQRWWRRTRYWRRVSKKWQAKVRADGVLEAQAYAKVLHHPLVLAPPPSVPSPRLPHSRSCFPLTPQELARRVAACDMRSEPKRCVAARHIQRVFRGWMHGRRLARRQRRAGSTVARVLRGGVVRRRTLPAVRLAAQVPYPSCGRTAQAHVLTHPTIQVRERSRGGLQALRFSREHKADDGHCDGIVHATLTLTAELERLQQLNRTDDVSFKQDWKAWEDRLNAACVNDVPLDSEWVAQKQEDGTLVFLHLKTKRTSAEHPNLKLADIHRKRQWVKVSRLREERRKAIASQVAKLQGALDAQHTALAGMYDRRCAHSKQAKFEM